MVPLRVTEVEQGLALVLTRQDAAELSLAAGDIVYLSKGLDGALRLTRQDPSREARLARGRAFMDRYHETFLELAK